MTKQKKRSAKLLSFVMTLIMVFTMIPATSFAVVGENIVTGEGGMLACHTVHDEACGYTAEGEGAPCLHSCEACVEKETTEENEESKKNETGHMGNCVYQEDFDAWDCEVENCQCELCVETQADADKPAVVSSEIILGTSPGYTNDVVGLQKAFVDVNADGKIVLGEDIAIGEGTIIHEQDKAVTLDLHGKKITSSVGTEPIMQARSGVTLTVMDSSVDQSGGIETEARTVIKVTGSESYPTYVTISGGTFTSTKGVCVDNPGGEVTISGGKFHSEENGVISNGGKMTISGGEITGTKLTGLTNFGTVVMTGGSIVSEKNNGIANLKSGSSNVSLTISGGTVKANDSGKCAIKMSGVGTLTIKQDAGKKTLITSTNTELTMGTVLFTRVNENTAAPVLYIESGVVENTAAPMVGNAVAFSDTYVTPENLSKYYVQTGGTVGKVYPAPETAVAQINDGTKYDTWEAAIAAAQTGDTIKLLKSFDIEQNKTILIDGKDITLDLNGHAITNKAPLMGKAYIVKVQAGASLVVDDTSMQKLGKIENTARNNNAFPGSSLPKTIENYGTLTLKGGTVANSILPCISNGGTFTIEGGKVDAPSTRAIANLDGKIIMTGGLVNGNTGIENSSTDADSINISGGKITSSSAAIANNGTGKITISGTAEIKNNSNSNTEGTITLENVPTPAATILDIQNGSVTNENGSGYAVYFKPTMVTADNIFDYYIQGSDATVGRVYPASPHAVITSPIDLSSAIGDMDCGHGGTPCWSYVQSTNTLTLNGVKVNVATGAGIKVPVGGIIMLATGTTNSVSNSSVIQENIVSTGAITIDGAGTLKVRNPQGKGIYAAGTLVIKKGIIDVVTGGSAISSETAITFEDGTVTAEATGNTSGAAVIHSKENPIKIDGGIVAAKNSVATGNAKPFGVEPTCGTGIASIGEGEWDNMVGKEAKYGKATAVTIGAAEYNSLQEAIDAAVEGDILVFQRNFKEKASVASNFKGAFTFDLNGKTAEVQGDLAVGISLKDVILTIQDSSTDKDGTLTVTAIDGTGDISLGMELNGLNLKSGSLSSTGAGGYQGSVGIRVMTDAVISGGSLTATGVNAEISQGLFVAGNVSISDGTVVATSGGETTSGPSAGIWSYGETNITGGTVTAVSKGVADKDIMAAFWGSKVTISGGMVTATAPAESKAIMVAESLVLDNMTTQNKVDDAYTGITNVVENVIYQGLTQANVANDIQLSKTIFQHDMKDGSLALVGTDGCTSSKVHVITGTSTTDAVAIHGGEHYVTLNGVNITEVTAPFAITDEATVNVTLKDDTINTLTAKTAVVASASVINAGVQVPAGTTLIIDGNGTLNATGAAVKGIGYAAGIGGNGSGSGYNAGKITIKAGKINAIGGAGAAGIGTGRQYNEPGGTVEAITITGGTVTATGDVGIGNIVDGDTGSVIISGGIAAVTATGTTAAIQAGTLNFVDVTIKYNVATGALPNDYSGATNVAGKKIYEGETQAVEATDIKITSTKFKVTFNSNGGSAVDSQTVTKGSVITSPSSPTKAGYEFAGWFKDEALTMAWNFNADKVTEDTTLFAKWTIKSSSGGVPSAGGGGGTKPSEDVTGATDTKATTDGNGNANVTVTDKNISDAVQAAKDAAKKDGKTAGDISVVINVATGDKNVTTAKVNLPLDIQKKIIGDKIGNVAVVIDQPDISVSMDLDTIKEMNKQANGDIQLTATRVEATKLSDEAEAAIGNRPAFDLKATYASGNKAITDFNGNSVVIAIPYVLQDDEIAENIYAVYVDENGKASKVSGSKYDEKTVRFSTDHFSVYGVGYDTEAAAEPETTATFMDINSHWAKADIEFVAERSIMSGTTGTTFSPATAMTRGMFVTALGRLAKAEGVATGKFSDVKADAYYAPYVNWAAEKGIVSGISATAFAPDKSINRQEMAVIMSNYAKAMGYTLPETKDVVTFADQASIGSWAAEAVKQMQMAAILSGKDGNKFDPAGTATRGEIAAVLHRYVANVVDVAAEK